MTGNLTLLWHHKRDGVQITAFWTSLFDPVLAYFQMHHWKQMSMILEQFSTQRNEVKFPSALWRSLFFRSECVNRLTIRLSVLGDTRCVRNTWFILGLPYQARYVSDPRCKLQLNSQFALNINIKRQIRRQTGDRMVLHGNVDDLDDKYL